MAIPTQAEIDALEAKVRSAERRVAYGDKSVEIDLKFAREELQRMKSEAAGAAATPRASRAAFSRD